MRSGRRRLVAGSLFLLFLLHNDFWLWHRLRWVAGLPAGLVYHVAFCAVCTVVYAVLVQRAWPGRA